MPGETISHGSPRLAKARELSRAPPEAACSKPLSPSMAAGVRREATVSERGGDDAVTSGPTGMQGLRHRPEVLPDTARQRGGDAERDLRSFHVQPQETGARRGSTERTQRGSGVPAEGVVRRADHPSKLALDLEPQHEGVDQVATAGTELLAEGENGRQERDAGMAAHVHVDIVEVERVGGSAVYKRRLARGGAEACPKTDASVGPPCSRTISQRYAPTLATTGERHAKGVKNSASRLFTGLGQMPLDGVVATNSARRLVIFTAAY